MAEAWPTASLSEDLNTYLHVVCMQAVGSKRFQTFEAINAGGVRYVGGFERKLRTGTDASVQAVLQDHEQQFTSDPP